MYAQIRAELLAERKHTSKPLARLPPKGMDTAAVMQQLTHKAAEDVLVGARLGRGCDGARHVDSGVSLACLLPLSCCACPALELQIRCCCSCCFRYGGGGGGGGGGPGPRADRAWVLPNLRRDLHWLP